MRINRNQLLSMQQVQLDQKCVAATARYESLAQRRVQLSNKVYLDRTIGEAIEDAKGSIER